jgi:hypothetical protein
MLPIDESILYYLKMMERLDVGAANLLHEAPKVQECDARMLHIAPMLAT